MFKNVTLSLWGYFLLEMFHETCLMISKHFLKQSCFYEDFGETKELILSCREWNSSLGNPPMLFMIFSHWICTEMFFINKYFLKTWHEIWHSHSAAIKIIYVFRASLTLLSSTLSTSHIHFTQQAFIQRLIKSVITHASPELPSYILYTPIGTHMLAQNS